MPASPNGSALKSQGWGQEKPLPRCGTCFTVHGDALCLLSLVLLTGGLTAVIYTDALQTLIMVLGALVLMFIGKGNLQWYRTLL